jgi:hypothetical protein
MPPGDATQPLFDALARLKQEWPARGWSWDSRLICLASTFTVPYEAQAKKAAIMALPAEYTSSSINGAPHDLREVATRTGGLRAGQFLFAGGPIGGLTAFGLWWPWGDGETISFRCGWVEVEPGREPWRRLRDIYGVSM